MQFVRESIFVSAIRSFFNALLAMIGVIIGIIALGVVLSAFSRTSQIVMTPGYNYTMEFLPDHKGDAKPLPDSAPVIYQIDLDGTIGLEESSGDAFIQRLRLSQHSHLLKSERVKAIFVNIQSPGGYVPDSNQIYQGLKDYAQKYNIPIYTYASGFCASGGYMAACATDKIFANRTCIVGSVGVKVGPFFNFHELINQYGVKAVELTAGKDKVKYPTFTPVPTQNGKDSTESYEDLITITDQLYQQFIDIVTTARSNAGLTKEFLVQKSGARVYLAPQAEKLGYVDHGNATRNETLEALAKAAGLEEATSYQVVTFRRRRSPLETVIQGTCKAWSMRAKEWIYGVPHRNLFDNKILYYCDMAGEPVL